MSILSGKLPTPIFLKEVELLLLGGSNLSRLIMARCRWRRWQLS